MTAHSPQLSLVHRFRRARQATQTGRSPLLILLHGYGSNEDDLMGLAPYLDPCFDLLSARAPHTLEMGGYAWFPIVWNAEGLFVRPADVLAAIPLAADFVAEAIAACHAVPERTLLLGFSQGATMSAGILLHRPDLAAGAILMSGFTPAELARPGLRLAGKRLLITHGLFDDVVPVELGRMTRDLFESLGASVTYREYPMGHQINDASLEDADRWLGEWLGTLS